ncbi:hypothetical protein HC891_09535 [Candidatus Gracilibacteria bacterium]|nr:hypothetical protein [Candidatus Gracilibacteria bacterium]
MNSYRCTRPVSLAGAESLGNLLRYLLLGRGMLTSNVAEALAFVRSGTGLPAPDIELIFAPAFFMEHGAANPAGHGFSLGVALLRPESRGSITLASGDPLTAPLIQPGYFSADADMGTLLVGLKAARQIAHAPAFDAYRGAEVWPGQGEQNDTALAAFVRAHFQTLYHPVGSCKMGDDLCAVVDNQLRVHGVTGLRVADASIMPTIIGGHPQAATLMIAERAAAFVLGRSTPPPIHFTDLEETNGVTHAAVSRDAGAVCTSAVTGDLMLHWCLSQAPVSACLRSC